MKKYVCTLTPNPALDLGGIVDNLIPNEKSYVHDQTIHPGGNAINVARILTRLKVPVLSTGFLGGGIGEEIQYLLDKEKVKNNFIKIEKHSRICVTVSNRSDHRQTRLTFPGPPVKKSEKEQLLEWIRHQKGLTHLVIGGSLPSGFTPSDIIHLIKEAKHREIPAVVDCPGDILKKIISAGPLLIKPNLLEFQSLVGKKTTSLKTVRQEAEKLLKIVPLICVSSVEGGTLLITRQKSYYGRIPRVPIRSTVGAGDSMVGAMVAQLFKENATPEDLLRWGLAASAATLSNPGTALGQAQQIKDLYKKTKVAPL